MLHLVRSDFTPFREPEIRTINVREETDAVIREGTIATDLPIRHRMRSFGGPVMVQLAITDEVLAEWRTMGIDRAPLMKNHGLNCDGGWFFGDPNPESDIYGNIEAFSIERSGTANLTSLRCDFRFLRSQTSEQFLETVRTAPYLATSVGFSFEEQDVVVQAEKHRNGLPLLRITRWRLAEGSVTTVGRDPTTAIRTYHMSEPTAPIPKQTGAADQNGMEAALNRLADILSTRNATPEPQPPPDPVPAADPPPNPPPAAQDEWESLTERAEKELGAEKALELVTACNGSLPAYRSAIKMALAAKVPATPPATDLDVGDDGATRAMQVFVASTLAQGLKNPAARQEWADKARKLDSDWEKRNIVRTCRDILLHGGRGYTHQQVYADMAPASLIATAQHCSTRNALDRQVETTGNGMMYYRTASSGLVPANLPAAYQDVLRISVNSGYTRFLLPLDRLAERRNVQTYNIERIVDMDMALEFTPLATHEQFLPVFVREQESTIQASAYGHRYQVSEEALVNDDNNVLVGLPELMGQLYAEGQNAAFVTAVTAAGNFTGDQIISGNPLDYSADVLTAVSRARQSRPVEAPAGEEVGLTTGKSTVLTPTAGIWGEKAFNEWFARTRELGVGDGIDDRASATVHEPLIRLRGNTPMDLNIATNKGVIYPGPETMFCPMVYGGVVDRTGMNITATSLVGTGERDVLRYTIATSFFAVALSKRKRLMYELTDNSIS